MKRWGDPHSFPSSLVAALEADGETQPAKNVDLLE